MKKKKDDPLSQYRKFGVHKMHESVVEQENSAANLVGGKRHAGSGALRGLKSDASSEDWQVECKQTGNESMSLKLEWLEKIQIEAMGKGKQPLLHIRFSSAENAPADWVMIPEWIFRRINGQG